MKSPPRIASFPPPAFSVCVFCRHSTDENKNGHRIIGIFFPMHLTNFPKVHFFEMLNSAVLNNPDAVSEKMTEALLIFSCIFLSANLIVDEMRCTPIQKLVWGGGGGRKNLVHNECSDGDRFSNKQRKKGQFHPYKSQWNRSFFWAVLILCPSIRIQTKRGSHTGFSPQRLFLAISLAQL